MLIRQAAQGEVLYNDQLDSEPDLGPPVALSETGQPTGKHVELARSEFVELLPVVLEDLQEIWLAFEKHPCEPRSSERSKSVARQLLISATAGSRGMLETWSFLPTADWRYLNNERQGELFYAR